MMKRRIDYFYFGLKMPLNCGESVNSVQVFPKKELLFQSLRHVSIVRILLKYSQLL